jgi:hypothetical protein
MARYQCWDRGASLKEALPESGIQSFFVMLSALNKLIGWPKGTSATTCVAMFARVINRGKYTYPLQTTTQLSMYFLNYQLCHCPSKTIQCPLNQQKDKNDHKFFQ